MIGAAIGDIVGSIYEFQNHRSREFDLFGPKNTFTDDTVCTYALASALLSNADPSKTLQSWCRRYPARGYGGRFHKWIRSDEPLPYNSYGNGAAMRVSSAAWLGESLEDALSLADRITAITHNHPEGLRGARAVTHSVFLALSGSTKDVIFEVVSTTYGYDLRHDLACLSETYKFDESCQGTVPQALACVIEADDFEGAIRNAISIGGDSDTIAAIAGSVAEPLFGIPPEIASKAMDYLPKEFCEIAVKVRLRCSAIKSRAASS